MEAVPPCGPAAQAASARAMDRGRTARENVDNIGFLLLENPGL
jgi:hypothetical protein